MTYESDVMSNWTFSSCAFYDLCGSWPILQVLFASSRLHRLYLRHH